MRTITLILSLLLTISVCSALDITTRKGVTYKQVTVTKVDPDGIRIRHADGAATIPFANLPEALQRQYNYDPAKVARDAQAQRESEQEEHRLAVAHEQARAEAEADGREQTQRTAIRAFTGVTIGLILLGLATYFLPTIVALMTGKGNTLAIFVLNLFLGWTLVGWVVALVWACTKSK